MVGSSSSSCQLSPLLLQQATSRVWLELVASAVCSLRSAGVGKPARASSEQEAACTKERYAVCMPLTYIMQGGSDKGNTHRLGAEQ